MFSTHPGKVTRNLLVLTGILAAAVLLSLALSGIYNDNNPFATPLFILAVTLIARLTDGYLYGILASLAGTFCVNVIFTAPFWSFDLSTPGYPLTFAMMLGVSVSISALTTQIKRQESLKAEAEQEKARANLLRAIAHDLRTPLTSILGASSALLEQDLCEQDRRKLAAGIQQDARWLVRITENLLSVTRFSDNNVILHKTDEVLEEIIGSAVVKYRRSPEALPVHTEMADEIFVVPMDPVLIEQVLINLFDNVSRHGGNATGIWLYLQPDEDSSKIALSVEDDGQGIPQDRLAGLFEGKSSSAQADSDRTRNMGIGLSVCRSIIQAHGGELHAGTSRHGGAAFAFTLPLVSPEELPEEEG